MEVDKSTQWLTDAYTKLENSSGIVPRPAQVQLSSEMLEAIHKKVPFIGEAPTGTGKTIAYLMAALAAQQSTGSPVLVATGTKALQEQLISNDVPRLVQLGLLAASDVAIAKGMGNYICLTRADVLLEDANQVSLDLGYVSDSVVHANLPEVELALQYFHQDSWNGDFDTFPATLSPDTKRAIGVSSDSCTKKNCPKYSSCPYFSAKAKISNRKLVVTNHDLLLLDFSLSAQHDGPGDRAVDIPPYHLIIDEAHHLPEKAIKAGAAAGQLTQLLTYLPRLQGAQTLITKNAALVAFLREHRVDASMLEKTDFTMALRSLIFSLMDIDVGEAAEVIRFPQGVLPEPVAVQVANTLERLQPLMNAFKAINSVLKDADPSNALTKTLRDVQNRIFDVQKLSKAVEQCLIQFSAPEGYAKWFVKSGDQLGIFATPLEGYWVLNEIFWPSKRVVSASMVSATLKDTNGFKRYLTKIGAPKQTLTVTLPYTFDYEKSKLALLKLKNTPKPHERKNFISEIKGVFAKRINPSEGTLVLFPSWALLRETLPFLQATFGEQFIKAQGSLGLKVLVENHKRDIDAGIGSALVGVSTMSEGLDLPGAYCTHVIITALPFAMPGSPVEEEHAEILGTRYFYERALPDALNRLSQMIGRLIRRETDVGTITVLDTRLASTQYGRAMLRALPPYTVVNEEP